MTISDILLAIAFVLAVLGAFKLIVLGGFLLPVIAIILLVVVVLRFIPSNRVVTP
jgi:hypothetical protein